MPAYTTTQAGNWATGATWVGGVAPTLSTDTQTINHAVTIAADALSAGLAINAALTVATTKKLTLAGNCLQANATFTLNPDSELIFDCTAADRKWLMGTASTQSNCKIVIAGTAGHYGWVHKTGSNYYWFDIGDENAGTIAGCQFFTCDYGKFTALGNSAHTIGIGISDWGTDDFYFRHCVFEDMEGPINAFRPYQWSAAGGGDFVVTDCTFTSTAAHQMLNFNLGASAPTGTVTFARNRFRGQEGTAITSPKIACHSSVPIDDCYFFNNPELANHGPLNRCWLRHTSRGQSITPGYSLTDLYILIDHISGDPFEVGNSHTINTSVPSLTYHGLVFDCVNATSLIDGADGTFGAFGNGTTVEYCLVIPLLHVGDGLNGNGSLVSFYSDVSAWTNTHINHNTVPGRGAQITFMEVGFSGAPKCNQMQYNLVGDPDPQLGGQLGTRGAHYLLDIGETGSGNPKDLIDPTTITSNWMQNPEAFTDPLTSISHAGYVGKMTGSLPGSNVVNTDTGWDGGDGPDFVDPTRNFTAWAVFMGAATVGQTRREKIDAALDLLWADDACTLAYTNLLPWVRNGWAPQNAATIIGGVQTGAVTSGEDPPPPPDPGAGLAFHALLR